MEKDKFAAFCDAVCTRVKHATPKERSAIRQELTDHLEDHAADLEKLGFSREDARDRAVLAMGDAEEIGEELNKQYAPFWRAASRVSAALLAVSVVLVLAVGAVPAQAVLGNIQARLSPDLSLLESVAERGAFPVGEFHAGPRMENTVENHNFVIHSGGSVCRLLQTGVANYGQWYSFYFYTASYAENLLDTEDWQTDSIFADCDIYLDGILCENLSGVGTWSHGVDYSIHSIPIITPENKTVTVVYDRYGEHFSLEVPIQWEEDV